MDDFLRDFIVKKWKIGRFTFTFLDALLAVCITGTGIFLRLPVINHTVTGPEKIGAVVLDYVLALLCAAIVYRCTAGRNRASPPFSQRHSSFLVRNSVRAASAKAPSDSTASRGL